MFNGAVPDFEKRHLPRWFDLLGSGETAMQKAANVENSDRDFNFEDLKGERLP